MTAARTPAARTPTARTPTARTPTGPVRRIRRIDLDDLRGIGSRADLARLGIGRAVVNGQVAAGRWRLVGSAVVLHNGPLRRDQLERAALINSGPRSALTSFTATARWGLQGWDRDQVHVLAPAGTRVPRSPGAVVLHRRVEWDPGEIAADRLHRPAPALIIAAGSFARPRPGCAILAAGVQQRLVTAPELLSALGAAPKLRHHGVLRLALADIAQGAEALSEIDFVRLCRRHRLPPPAQQAVRREPGGRRRYLDAQWRRPDGSAAFAVEVDGAIHMDVVAWSRDEVRQNEVVLQDVPVLRYPSVLLRTDEALVADQLRRALARW